MRGMRRLLVAMVSAALFVTALAGPALANQPITFQDSVTFPDVNPCSGEDMEVTLNFDVSIHEHSNNFVVLVHTTGTTDSGFTMIKGIESFGANSNVERAAFQDQWRHPDGSKFRASGSFVFNINKEELLVDRFDLVCVGDN